MTSRFVGTMTAVVVTAGDNVGEQWTFYFVETRQGFQLSAEG